jgi:iron complex outermembrane receptor protein
MLLGALVFAAAQAATVPSADKGEEIIVTGERVKRSLKDTPASVHVVTARELQAMPADRLEQVLAGIPNVQFGSGSQGPVIRGQDSTGVLNSLPAFLGGARPRATLEVDGRAVGFQEFVFGTAPLFDVHQIEVFRSPLTVTHGRNSIGGGIVLTTNDPSYGWEGAARAIAGNFSTRELSGVVSGPIITDQLAFRVASDIRQSRTTAKLADVMRGANPNDDKYSQVRFKLLAEPRALPGLKLVATFTRSYSQAPQDVPIARPFRERRFPFGGYGIFGVHVSSATLHASEQWANGQVEAVVSFGDTHTRRYAQPGLGEARAHLRDLTGEVFGSWKPASWLTMRGGLHTLDDRFGQFIDVTNFMGSVGDFRDHQKSFGAFTEAEAALTDRLTVSAGGRYQEDSQSRKGGLAGAVTAPIEFDKRFSAWLPKVTAAYALTPQLKAGVLIQKAYNPGGATLDFDTGGLDSFAAEHLWDYEIFLKGELPGGKVSIETNVFYNDMRDAQRGVAVPFTGPNGEPEFLFKFNNVSKASTRGAELELGWHPSDALSLSGGIGLLRTRIRSSQNSDGDLIGREFQLSPHLTASAAADWTPTNRLRISAQLRYHSSYFSDDFDDPKLRVGRAAIVNARAAYTLRKFTVFAYARNVFNSFHLSLWAQRDPDIVEADDPRVAGVGIEARF